jgi:hypothetical protein
MNAEMLYALRDPAGIPSHPLVFLLLAVLTFALHVAAVQVMLGAGALVLRGAFSAQPHWRRLAATMLNTAKIAVSVAIVIGVAPLLFVQVLYDPFWYTSNVLSARWVIGFILILIAGYIAMYGYYWRNPNLATQPAKSSWMMMLSLALLLLVGWIMHVLSYQMLWPEQWQQWYAPQGRIDASGSGLHAYSLARFGFFIALSAPVTGAWLVAVRRYLQGAGEGDVAYLAFLARLARALMLPGGVLALAVGALWLLTLPEKMAFFATSPWMLATLVLLLVAVALPTLLGERLERGLWGYAVFGVGAVALMAVAAAREVLRYTLLSGVHGYDALDYKINMDWYSTLTFFITFGVLGSVTLGYLLTVAWQAGQHRGGAGGAASADGATAVYTPSAAVTRFGRWSVGLLVVWIVHYFAVGFYTMVR